MEIKEYNKLSEQIIGCCIAVHKELGPGLLERVYEECLAIELENSGLNFKRQVHLPVIYKGEPTNQNFRLDFLIEDEIILELKAIEVVLPIHEVILVTYLKIADKKLGLLVNFHEEILTKGIKRKVNNLR
ncbi:MAG: GxxExxY protein [Bacteroidia bacterium]